MAEPAAEGNNQRLVMVVDDEPDIVEEMVELLELEGWSVLWATDPIQAVDQVINSSSRYLVITDVRMPVLDGFEMIRRIQAGRPGEDEVRFIVITGHLAAEDFDRAESMGVCAFIPKPCDPEQLIAATRRAIS